MYAARTLSRMGTRRPVFTHAIRRSAIAAQEPLGPASTAATSSTVSSRPYRHRRQRKVDHSGVLSQDECYAPG
jgi:hypothetical protein